MRVLVTGGMGYVGSSIVDYLLKYTDHDITILDRLDFQVDPVFFYNISMNKRVNFVRGDIRDLGKIYMLINDNDVVINAAALVGEDLCHRYPNDAVLTNEVAAKTIANICRDLKKHLVILSTCSNYGKSEHLVTESGELLPVSLYAITKVNLEKYIINNKIPAIILRCGTAFGYSPGRTRFDLMINEWICDTHFNKKLKVFQPEAWRPFCHVRDIAKAVRLAVGRSVNSPKVLNIISFNITKIDLAKVIAVSDEDVEVVNRGDMRDYKVSGKEAQDWLGFIPELGVSTAIEELTEHIYNETVDIHTSNV